MEAAPVKTITLISNEGDRHPVDIGVARTMSGLVRGVLENDEETTEIRLPNVNSAVLGSLIQFCSRYQVDPMQRIERPLQSHLLSELVQQWYAHFANNVGQDRLFELFVAALYMQIEPLEQLMDLTCAAVAIVFNGRTLGQMRELLGTIRLPEDDLLRAHILTRVGSFLHPGSSGVFHVVVNLARNPGAPVPFPNGGLIYDA